MRRYFSPDAYVMLRPADAFHALAAQPGAPGSWTAWRRPLFIAFLIGCTISLTTTGSLTLRLVVSTALSWSFVPAIDIAALALVLHGAGHWGRLPRLVDVFCMGWGVWSAWLIGVSIIFAAVPPAHVFRVFYGWLEIGGVLVLAWSAYVDYCFFHEVLRCSAARARRVLLLHRLLSWIPILLIISLPAIVPTILFFAGR
jgi:hypothetical protein